jgi:predicted metal-dependent hydrolase
MFDRGEYFACHELLEEIWRETPSGEDRTYLQALIQVAVALYHHQQGNQKGANGVYQRARARLLTLPRRMRGLALPELIDALDHHFREGGGAPLPQLVWIEQIEELDAGTVS